MRAKNLLISLGVLTAVGLWINWVNFLRSTCGRPTLHFLLNRSRRLHDLEANGRLTVVSAQAHLLEANLASPMPSRERTDALTGVG